MSKAYLMEFKWGHEKVIPTMNEYLENGVFSIGCFGFQAATYHGMDEEIANINAYEWLFSLPKVLRATYTIARLRDDTGGHKVWSLNQIITWVQTI